MKYEECFQEALWEDEQVHLAQQLKVERLPWCQMSSKNARRSIEEVDKHTEIVLQWLAKEWGPIVEVLRQREPDCEWPDIY